MRGLKLFRTTWLSLMEIAFFGVSRRTTSPLFTVFTGVLPPASHVLLSDSWNPDILVSAISEFAAG